MSERVVIFDVDGTLVDSVYQHTLAWQRAFRAHELTIPSWRIHRQIGKGGDRLVAAVAGEQVEASSGDAIRDAHDARFKELIDEVRPFEGARELLAACDETGWRVALASSGKADEVDRYVRLLDADELLDAIVSSADVETTKPAPDMLATAHERACAGEPGDPGSVLVVGDATWDCEAARTAGMVPVGLLSGGFGAQELRDAGAEAVFATLPELRRAIDALMPVR